MDLSFSTEDKEFMCAGLVVCEFPHMKIVYEDFQFYKIDVPYVPGFLAFRELPATRPLLEKLKATKPDLVPQVVLVDGNGIFHPRGFGLASHLGVTTGIPSIGCSKTVFALDGINKKSVRALSKTLKKGGEAVKLQGKSGKIWGAVYSSPYQAVGAPKHEQVQPAAHRFDWPSCFPRHCSSGGQGLDYEVPDPGACISRMWCNTHRSALQIRSLGGR